MAGSEATHHVVVIVHHSESSEECSIHPSSSLFD